MPDDTTPLPPELDITSKRFGSWLVLRYTGRRGTTHLFYCRCRCGVERNIPRGNLVGGKSTACRSCSKKTHNQSQTPLYKYWDNCKRRLNLCEQWRSSFDAFRATITEPRPGFMLVAIDESKPIGPDNYQWMEAQRRRMQMVNQRSARHVVAGVNATTQELMASMGVTRQRVQQILNTIKGKCRACGKPCDRDGYRSCSACARRSQVKGLDARIEATRAKLTRLEALRSEIQSGGGR